jgi:thiol-disulfide isomerase/thioredoxin
MPAREGGRNEVPPRRNTFAFAIAGHSGATRGLGFATMRCLARSLCVVLVLASGGCTRHGGSSPESRAAVTGSPPVVPISARQIQTLARRPGARATLVNVWATWCAPCRAEFPALLRTARSHRTKGLRLVLVSADAADQLPEVRRFLADQGVTDTTYLQSGSEMAFIDTMNPKWSGALPATFLYDRDGVLVSFWEGAADESRLSRSVDPIIARYPPGGNSRP